jgi:hypothetical protein
MILLPICRVAIVVLASTLAAGPVQEVGTVRVGPNVQVSKALSDVAHWEVVLAEGGGPEREFLAASMVRLPDDFKIVVYASRDGGKTWKPALDLRKEANTHFGDPALARGADDTIFFVCDEIRRGPGKSKDTADDSMSWLRIFRSGDGGRNWDSAARITGFWDRPFLAVDRTKGKYKGRVYCLTASGLFVSTDAGKSFDKARLWPGHQFGDGFPVVLADGTLAVLYGPPPAPGRQSHLEVRTSTDGADSFSEKRVLAERGLPDGPLGKPSMATDPARPGRLYVVWQDKLPSGRSGIRFAFSADKGATFSRPVLLSEQSEGADYDAFVPSLAVNAAGTVAVTWYDTRELASEQDVRFRASTDGGRTWAPSVRVTEETSRQGKKTRPPASEVGHTAGLAAEGDTGFRCLWIDRRTGVAQVWTATVQVDGPTKSSTAAADWTQFRGHGGSGTSADTGVPEH